MLRVVIVVIILAMIAPVVFLESVPVVAMTGSGTEGDPYVIYNVTDLQNMQNDLDAYYELANDIDASATSGWNGGSGFVPLGRGFRLSSYVWPSGDYENGGNWTIYPSDGIMWDKVNSSDGDSTYIIPNAGGTWAYFVITSHNLCLGDLIDAVRIQFVRKGGSASAKPYMQIGGVDWEGDSTYIPSSTSVFSIFTYGFSTNPLTGLPWTPAEANSITAVGLNFTSGNPTLKVTAIYSRVIYDSIFTGYFNGNDHAISNLSINRSSEDYIGLFGYTDGIDVEDVELKDSTIIGDEYVGTLVGYTVGSNISGVVVSNTTIISDELAGGLVGWVDVYSSFRHDDFSSLIIDCSASGSIDTPSPSFNGYYFGGLVGELYYSTVLRCYADVDILVGDGFYMGGFIADVTSSNISQCFATGDIYGAEDFGGFAAYFMNGSNVVDCYARGSCISTHNTSYNVAGFTPYNWDGNITNCYATGNVSFPGLHPAGFCSENDGIITDCFWDMETSGQLTSEGGGTGKSTAEMKAKSTFTDAGWAFEEAEIPVWDIADNCNDGYPYICTFCYLPWLCIGGCYIPEWPGNYTQVLCFQPNSIINGTTLLNRI
jgi:hypothetical protein